MAIEGKSKQVTFNRKLRFGMVGGGRDAFIGAVHRAAAQFDGDAEIVAGCFSSTPEKSKASGEDLFLDPNRVYGSYQEMAEAEAAKPDDEKLDFVSVVTPNHLHYPIIKTFLEAGFNVVTDKPMTFDLDEAHKLGDIVKKSGKVFAVTYNYTGYPMVRQARHMVKSGQLGKIQKVMVEFPQDWLITRLEEQGVKQAIWRTDPKQAGAGGALGDICTHAENMANYVADVEIEELCADLTIFAKGRQLDDDCNVLVHYTNGARGILSASQISTGNENGFNFRVFGTEGGLRWVQENPNYLYYFKPGEPAQILSRNNGYLGESSLRASRIPPGHPEAFYEAFANIYMNIMDTIRANIMGRKPTELELEFPKYEEGLRGMQFIATAVESHRSKSKWTSLVK